MIASVGKGGGPYQPRAWLAIARQKAETAAAGPSGCCQTPAETARKSAPAATSGPQFSTVIPPMATQGASIRPDRKSVVSGKSVSVRVDLGGRRIIKKKKKPKKLPQ